MTERFIDYALSFIISKNLDTFTSKYQKAGMVKYSMTSHQFTTHLSIKINRIKINNICLLPHRSIEVGT